MRIVVPREGRSERRVALTPQVVRLLVADGHAVAIEPGAGGAAYFTDQDFADAGGTIDAAACSNADLIATVGPPHVDRVATYPPGIALIGFLDPFAATRLLRTLAERRITAFAMEAIPRTTLAQTMDALSSQASVAGYHAVLLAATTVPRIFPLMMTAAGTIRPARVLVLGAGVAGLQAIATAKRLGAVVSAYDIRPQVRQEIESLGARFVSAPVDESAATASGYATAASDEMQRGQQRALDSFVAEADVVIATAQVPDRPAPLLISRQMVDGMKRGSVIVDVAAPTGGNCELTEPDEYVDHDGVVVMGPTDLAARVAIDASEMYARNVAAFIERICDDDGRLTVDVSDEIVAAARVTQDGVITHPVSRRVLGSEPRP